MVSFGLRGFMFGVGGWVSDLDDLQFWRCMTLVCVWCLDFVVVCVDLVITMVGALVVLVVDCVAGGLEILFYVIL